MTPKEYLLAAKFPQVLFSAKGGIATSLIKFYLDTQFSHISFCWGNNEVFDAQAGGVNFHSILEYENCDWFLLEPTKKFTPKELHKFKNYLLTKKGAKYDFWSTAGLILKFKRAKNSSLFCSEFVEDGFRYMNFPLVPRKSVEKSHPELLLQSWRLREVAKFNKEKNHLVTF